MVTKTLALPLLISAEKLTGVKVVDEPSGVKLLVDPKVVMNAFVPSWVTFASTNSNLEFPVSVIDIKYFALLYVSIAKESICVADDADTVTLASAISECDKDAPALAKDNAPAPFVFINCPFVPSEVGKVNPLIVTPPVPFPVNSRFALDAFVLIVLSVRVTPSTVIAAVVLKVVKVPATAVEPPITVLSIVPSSMSAFVIITCPVPEGLITKSLFEFVVLITLSVMFISPSIVKFEMLTTPVPPGVMFILLLDDELIVLSLKVKLSTVRVPPTEKSPLTVRFPPAVKSVPTAKVEPAVTAPVILAVPSTTNPSFKLIVDESVELKVVPLIVIAPAIIFPVPDGLKIKSELDAVAFISLSVMLMLSSNVKLDTTTEPVPPGVNLRSAFESVEITLSKIFILSIPTVPVIVVVPVTVKEPKVDNPSTVSVPVVDKFSLPKEIEPPESVIEPLASVMLPIVEPVPAVMVPVVDKFSLPKLMAPEESVIDPSAKVKLPIVDPDPAVIAPVMLAEPDTDIVPSTIKPSFILIDEESSELKVVPTIFIAPNTTDPVPEGKMFISSLDRTPSILLSLNLIAGKSTAPVPDGVKIKSSLLLFAAISLPVKLIPSANKGDAYNSVKFSFTLIIAARNVSPVPSFALVPTFKVC